MIKVWLYLSNNSNSGQPPSFIYMTSVPRVGDTIDYKNGSRYLVESCNWFEAKVDEHHPRLELR